MQNKTVTLTTGEQATVLRTNTVDIMTEAGEFAESTTYTVHIKGQGTMEVHEANILR